MVARAHRLGIVEAGQRDVQVIGLGRLAEHELGAARRAEQALGLGRGAIDGGLALDPGEAMLGPVSHATTGAPAERWHIRQWQ